MTKTELLAALTEALDEREREADAVRDVMHRLQRAIVEACEHPPANTIAAVYCYPPPLRSFDARHSAPAKPEVVKTFPLEPKKVIGVIEHVQRVASSFGDWSLTIDWLKLRRRVAELESALRIARSDAVTLANTEENFVPDDVRDRVRGYALP